jgi:hypothetical protein
MTYDTVDKMVRREPNRSDGKARQGKLAKRP